MNKLALSILSFSASSASADSEIIDRITLNENLNRVNSSLYWNSKLYEISD